MEDREVNIVLFGPPGSGKGTQGEKLVKEFNLVKVSAGDLLREEIKKNNPLGIKIKPIVNKGLFVSDDIINNLIEVVISNKTYTNRIIFDGYPRNLNQAINLGDLISKHYQKISCVISLKVNKDTIIKRILGRQVCSKCNLIFNKYFNPPKKENYECKLKYLKTRPDDNEETITSRFKTYNEDTLPIINYYKNQNLLHEIDGMKGINEIYEEIRGFIHSLET